MNDSASLLVQKQSCLPFDKPCNRSIRNRKHSVNPEVGVGHACLSALTIDNILLHCSGNDVDVMMHEER